MGVYASLALLADTASSLQSFVSVFVGIYVLLIFAYVLPRGFSFRTPARPQLCKGSWTKSAVRIWVSSEAAYPHSGHWICRRSWPSSSCSLRPGSSTAS